jgi:hypothetical protein
VFVPSRKFFNEIQEILKRHHVAIGDEVLFAAFNDVFDAGYAKAREVLDRSYGR